MPDKDEKQVCLGVIIGVHGVRGEVVIKSYTAAPEDVGAYGPLKDQSGNQQFSLANARPSKKGVVARIKGIDYRDQALALKGTELFVDRARLPAPEDEDEFYYTDLIGLEALSEDGEQLGRVTGVHDFGAGDLIEVELTDGGQSALFPFTRKTVPNIDLKSGHLTLLPPEELEVPPEPASDDDDPS